MNAFTRGIEKPLTIHTSLCDSTNVYLDFNENVVLGKTKIFLKYTQSKMVYEKTMLLLFVKIESYVYAIVFAWISKDDKIIYWEFLLLHVA